MKFVTPWYFIWSEWIYWNNVQYGNKWQLPVVVIFWSVKHLRFLRSDFPSQSVTEAWFKRFHRKCQWKRKMMSEQQKQQDYQMPFWIVDCIGSMLGSIASYYHTHREDPGRPTPHIFPLWYTLQEHQRIPTNVTVSKVSGWNFRMVVYKKTVLDLWSFFTPH